MVEDRPLGSWISLLKGVLGGSLICSGIFSLEFGIGAQIIVFIIGLLIVIDSVISKTDEIYPLTMFLGFIVGFFIALFCVIGKISLYWTLFVIILAALVYLGKLIKKLKRH